MKTVDRILKPALFLGLTLAAAGPAAANPLFVAVPDGRAPGIYRAEDLNADRDALDDGELTLYAQLPHRPTDVAVSGLGVVYAITDATAHIYRMDDLNKDGDALDAGEVSVFREISAGQASGVLLKRPTSLAVSTFYDPFKDQVRVWVYTMDVVLQQSVRLEDLDGDGDANDAAELVALNTESLAFTPERMAVDGAGRLVAVNANRLSLVRIYDLNGDFDVPGIKRQTCPVETNGCGPWQFGEFQLIRTPQAQQKLNLEGPYGVAPLQDGSWLVSDPGSGYVYKLTDTDLDEDALDAPEIRYYAEIGEQTDIVTDARDTAFLGTPNHSANVQRLEDRNADGDLFDPDEVAAYASVPGTPAGLDLLLPFDKRSLTIVAESGFEMSPFKGPVLVVEPGMSSTMSLRVLDRSTGDPVPALRMANGAINGCFSICSTPQNRTGTDGLIQYEVRRTADLGQPESIKFWTEGQGNGEIGQNENVLLVPIVRTACTPDPIADGGPDQVVSAGSSVLLDGSASTGDGLQYCWTQTAGPDVGLPECDGSSATASFTAPAAPAELAFALTVRNACDEFSEPGGVGVRVPEPCDADGDGAITAQDATAVRQYLATGTPLAGDGDCNADGTIDRRDVLAIWRKASPRGSP